jgi:membrane protein
MPEQSEQGGAPTPLRSAASSLDESIPPSTAGESLPARPGQPRGRLALSWWLITQTVEEFSKVRADLLAAALAFHTLLAMAPLIIIAVAVAGLVLDRAAALDEATRLLSGTLGPTGASTVREWVQEASEGGKVASFVGFALLAWTASRLGTELREALNQLWSVDVFMAEGFKSSIRDYVQRRLFAFVIVLAAGPLLLLVFASRTLLTAFDFTLLVSSRWQALFVQLLQIAGSILLVALTCAAVFRFVPDKRIGWKNVLVGGSLTSILFNVGNALVSLYLGRASVSEAYGAAGSAVVVLLWLYFSAQMFLLGAKFTHVYSRRFGWGLTPAEAVEARHAKLEAQKARDAA